MYGFVIFLTLQCIVSVVASPRQCFTCRSRGELGDCRDPFPFNATTGIGQPGLKLVPCPSGWCGKTIEGVRGPPDDFGTATERTCLSQAPPDGEERCAELRINNKASLLCVCRGSLCNSAPVFVTGSSWITFLVLSLGAIMLRLV